MATPNPGPNQGLNIDLTDPHVQHLLGGDPRLATVKREVVQLAGDAPDPTGMTALRGAQSTTRLSAGKREVVVVYKGMFLTVDIYIIGPGGVGGSGAATLTAYLVCPRCHKVLTVPGNRKTIDYEPGSANPVRTEILASKQPELVHLADQGRLSIETFECTWEIDDAPHVAGRHHTGTSLCRLRLAIDGNRARDA